MGMGETDPLLATYGTLLRAFDRHEMLGIADGLSLVGPCRVKGVLYDLGEFPGAVQGEEMVRAELFRVRSDEVWAVLDRYEGYVPGAEERSLFVRRRTPIHTPAGQTAWVYWYTGPTEGRSRVSGGDWRAYVEAKPSRQ